MWLVIGGYTVHVAIYGHEYDTEFLLIDDATGNEVSDERIYEAVRTYHCDFLEACYADWQAQLTSKVAG